MKQILILVALLLMLSPALAENLLKNGSFEERDPAKRALPKYWTEASPSAAPLEFTGYHYQGATSGMIVGDGKEHIWRQNVLAPPVRAFTLSAFVKADDVKFTAKDDYAYLYGHIIYKGLPYESATHFFAKIQPGTYDWKRVSIVGGANNDAPIEMVLISVTGKFSGGKMYVDQVALSGNEQLTPEALLRGKVEDLNKQLARIEGADASVAEAQKRLAEAKKLLDEKSAGSIDPATQQWIGACEALSHEVWVKMFPKAMTDKPVEARMIYHAGLGQTKEDCDRSFDILQRAGGNGTYHSLGAWTSAIYHSELLPVEPGWEKFDALKYSIEEARRRGIKSFGYLAALYGTSSPPAGPDSLYTKHPEWFATGPDANMPKFPDPANPEVADFIVKVYTELATKYDLDGIGLDYIRYPTETSLNYDENNRQQILKRYGFDIKDAGDMSRDPEKWAKIKEYRAEKVGEIVKRVHDAVKAAKPNMAIIACLISDPDMAYDYGQNWAKSSVLLDYASPMNYDDVSADLKLLARQRQICSDNRAVFIPAIGGMPEVHQAWTISTWAERVANQRAIGGDGIIIYRMNGFDPAVGAFFGKGPFYGKSKFPEPISKK